MVYEYLGGLSLIWRISKIFKQGQEEYCYAVLNLFCIVSTKRYSNRAGIENIAKAIKFSPSVSVP